MVEAYKIMESDDVITPLPSDVVDEHGGLLYTRRRSLSVPNIHVITQVNQKHAQNKHTILGQHSLGITDVQHKDSLFSVLSLLYAIILMTVGVAVPITEIFGHNSHVYIGSLEGFYVYLFAVSLIFLFYIHFFVVHDRTPTLLHLKDKVVSWYRRRESTGQEGIAAIKAWKPKSSQHGRLHTGSFYLRLGAIGFGIGGMIQDGLEFGQFFERDMKSGCIDGVQVVRPLLELVFIFVQMYMIFKHSKTAIHRERILARFGMMHLVATNLCVWFRVITTETIHELHHLAGHHGSDHGSDHGADHGSDHGADHGSSHGTDHGSGHGSDDSGHSGGHSTGNHSAIVHRSIDEYYATSLPTFNATFLNTVSSHVAAVSAANGSHGDADSGRLDCGGGGGAMAHAVTTASPYLYACTVEYSLIAAGVAYLMWCNIGRSESHGHGGGHLGGGHIGKKPQRVSFDCSGSNRGLFLGILMLIGTVVSIIVFFALVSRPQSSHFSSTLVMYSTEILLYVTSAVAVIGAAHGFRRLKFNSGAGGSLDEILLVIANIGLYMFYLFSAICGTYRHRQPLGILIIFNSVIVMAQATLQTLFILNGLRRCAASSREEEEKPGREYVTFLVVTNIAMWAVNSFEVLRSDSNPLAMDFYGTLPWMLITHVSVPLDIFYRYHSTVCLTDIWLGAYKLKSHHH